MLSWSKSTDDCSSEETPGRSIRHQSGSEMFFDSSAETCLGVPGERSTRDEACLSRLGSARWCWRTWQARVREHGAGLRRRLINTNHCPLVGSSPKYRRTRADNPSNEHRMSVGWVHSQIRPAERPLNMAPSDVAVAPHPHRDRVRPPTRLAPTKWATSASAPSSSAPRTRLRGVLRPPASASHQACVATGRMCSAPIRVQRRTCLGSDRTARTARPAPATARRCAAPDVLYRLTVS